MKHQREFFFIFLFIFFLTIPACAESTKPISFPTTDASDNGLKNESPTSLRINEVTSISQHTSTPTNEPTITVSTPTPTAIASSTPALPQEHYILNITGHKQFFSLGCETSTAIDFAHYFGVDINEFDFQYKIPQSDNPDEGFVGTVDGPWGQVPPYAYGVHAVPIAKTLSAFGIPAKGLKDFTLEQVKSEIAADRPVIAWVIGNVVGGVPYEYTDKNGAKTIVAAYEHVIIITGYNHEKIRYMNNGNFFESPNAIFLNSWGVLGDMVVIKQ
jgi:uncharacterized protein YvpB